MKDKSVYQGELKFGVFDGFGHLKMPNKNQYEGQFKDGLYHGEGNLTFRSGKIRKGQFEKGKVVKWLEFLENKKFMREMKI